jgi:hypothetical protein
MTPSVSASRTVLGFERLRRCGVLSLLAAPHLFAFAASVSFAQVATPASPVPATSIAIENTNAAFAPTGVNIPQANPARPTVTIPAHLPPTGYLQFEQGVVRAAQSPGGTGGQLALSQTTKIALTTRWLVQFITQPYAYSSLNNTGGSTTHSSDPGDLQFGVQGVLHKAVGPLPTVAAGFIRRVRAGTSASLDAGSYAQSALILLGGDVRGGFHYDANLLFNEQNRGPVRRAQFAQTLAVTHALFPVATRQRLNGIVELSHFTQPLPGATPDGLLVSRANACDLLFVGTYTLRPNLIVDASVDRGLTSTSTHWQGGFGFSYILPHRLWADRHPVPIPVGNYTYERSRSARESQRP